MAYCFAVRYGIVFVALKIVAIVPWVLTIYSTTSQG